MRIKLIAAAIISIFALTPLLASYSQTIDPILTQHDTKIEDRLIQKDLLMNEEPKQSVFLSGSLLLLSTQTGLVLTKKIHPGFRIGLGANARNWEPELTFTYYDNGESDDFFEASELSYSDPRRDIELDYRFSINDFEALIASPWISKHGYAIQPLFGIEYATSKREFQLVYHDSPISDAEKFTSFRGIGPQIGFRIQKELFTGINFIASLTQSVLRSKISSSFDKYRRFTPVTKARFGSEWYIGSEGENSFYLSATYEGQYWVNEAIIANEWGLLENYNLGLHGFTLQAKLDF